MKKLTFSILAASALVMASCSNDDLTLNQGGYQDGMVMFSLDMPANLSTRAVNDGLSATQLDYAVFDEDGSFLFEKTAAAVVSDKTANVQVPLANGKNYTVAFFAKNPEAPYSINNGVLTADYTGAKANDDKFDAFYNAVSVSVNPSMAVQQVTLTRPFAQVNFAATDWADAKTAGFEVKNSGISYSAEVYTSMNLLDGSLAGSPTTVQFAVNTLPDYNAGAADIIVAGNSYDWVGMTYVLAPGDGQPQLVNTVTYTYEGPTGNTGINVNTVPVKRNHRTNIVGAFFTTQGSFDIIIDNGFDSPDYEPAQVVEASSLKAAIESAQSGAILAVTAGDITSQLIGLNSALVADKDITIIGADSYGTVIDFNQLTAKTYRLIYLNGLGNVTFKGIKFQSLNANYVGLVNAKSATYVDCLFDGVIFEYIKKETFLNCTFNIDFNAYPLWTYGANDITLEGCTFNNSAKGKAILVYGDLTNSTISLTVNNCTFNTGATSGDKCAVEIHSETGYNGNININNSTANGSAWLDLNGGLWREVDNSKGTNGEPTYQFNVFVDGTKVQGSKFPEVGSNGELIVDNPHSLAYTLTELINSATSATTVELTADIDMSGVEYKHSDLGYNGPHPNKHITINGNGHAISNLEVSGLQASLLPWTSQGFSIDNLHIKNSKFTGINADNEYSCAAAFGAFCDYTAVNVTNCSLDNVEISNAKYAGGFVAYTSSHQSSFTNCVIKNSKITSAYKDEGSSSYKGHAGGIVGLFSGNAIKDCGVENVTFSVKGLRGGIFVGTAQEKALISSGNWVKGNSGLSSYVGLDYREDKTTDITVL